MGSITHRHQGQCGASRTGITHRQQNAGRRAPFGAVRRAMWRRRMFRVSIVYAWHQETTDFVTSERRAPFGAVRRAMWRRRMFRVSIVYA